MIVTEPIFPQNKYIKNIWKPQNININQYLGLKYIIPFRNCKYSQKHIPTMLTE